MIGHDSTWIPKSLAVLRDKLPEIHVVISTQNSPQLAAALSQGLIDVAFLRQEDGGPGLEYLLLTEEPLQVYLPKDHPLAKRTAISLQEVAGETFLSISGTAMSTSGRPPALRLAIDRYLKKSGVKIKPSHEVDNLGGMMSLIVSTGGVALLPAYAKAFPSQFSHNSSPSRFHAEDRSVRRLSRGERLSRLETVSFENK